MSFIWSYRFEEKLLEKDFFVLELGREKFSKVIDQATPVSNIRQDFSAASAPRCRVTRSPRSQGDRMSL
jgi:hypothetical protein